MRKKVKKIYNYLFSIIRAFYWKFLSNHKIVQGKPNITCKVLCLGRGKIYFEDNVQLGYFPSPFFYNGTIYLEARSDKAFVKIGKGTVINNNACIVADCYENEKTSKSGILIGNNCLIGVNFKCFNSDFHSLNPNDRGENIKYDDVVIGDNVFIGNDVTILKGVVIGNGCTIGAGSVVTKSFPENCVIGGNPAKIIKRLEI